MIRRHMLVESLTDLHLLSAAGLHLFLEQFVMSVVGWIDELEATCSLLKSGAGFLLLRDSHVPP